MADDAENKTEEKDKQDTDLDEFFLTGSITDDSANTLITAFYRFAKSKQRRTRKPTITLNILSGGGAVAAALDIYEAIMRLREWGFVVNTRAAGFIGSAAVAIFQAGEKRILGPYTQVLVHGVAGRTGGTLLDMQGSMRTFELSQQAVAGILADNNTAGHDDPQYWIDTYFEKDNYLSAQEALELGLADEILTGRKRAVFRHDGATQPLSQMV